MCISTAARKSASTSSRLVAVPDAVRTSLPDPARAWHPQPSHAKSHESPKCLTRKAVLNSIAFVYRELYTAVYDHALQGVP
jgi:hypothetical protein